MIRILKNFFILIGDIVLQLINILTSKPELTIELTIEKSKNEDDQLDKIRNRLIPYFTSPKIMLVFLILFFIVLIISEVEVAFIYLTVLVMIYIFLIYYPQMKEKNSYNDLNRELPYALRHMGIELKSGKGLHESMMTIRNADYGSLSREFNRVLEEIKFGKTTEESLLEMSKRVNSDGLTRTIHQIIGALRVGGNVANSLEVIAQDISFEMQIKLKEYSQKLNSFILIYTFIAILAPVISLIMLMAGSTVMGDMIPASMLFTVYVLFFPAVIVFMGVFIKRLEPQI